ncbi:TPA: LysR family transcriptional regulator [Escherichia coli]|nr:LysR family transcriptional regulator [Escherichia coli]
MNSIFTEENLLAFTTAARFGSFSKAAEELGLTTSAISYTIKPRFYVSTSKSIIKALINMHSFEIQLSPIG